MELPHLEKYEYDDEGWDSDDSRYQESGVTFKSQKIARFSSKTLPDSGVFSVSSALEADIPTIELKALWGQDQPRGIDVGPMVDVPDKGRAAKALSQHCSGSIRDAQATFSILPVLCHRRGRHLTAAKPFHLRRRRTLDHRGNSPYPGGHC